MSQPSRLRVWLAGQGLPLNPLLVPPGTRVTTPGTGPAPSASDDGFTYGNPPAGPPPPPSPPPFPVPPPPTLKPCCCCFKEAELKPDPRGIANSRKSGIWLAKNGTVSA